MLGNYNLLDKVYFVDPDNLCIHTATITSFISNSKVRIIYNHSLIKEVSTYLLFQDDKQAKDALLNIINKRIEQFETKIRCLESDLSFCKKLKEQLL